MKLETQNLLASLEVIVENLSSSYAGIASDGHEPFHAFAWSVTEQGEFNFAQLLRSLDFLRKIDLTTITREWQSKTMYYSQAEGVVRELPVLIETLTSQLKTVQAYQLKTYIEETCTPSTDGFDGFEACELIVGETHDGDWIGICPCFPRPHTVHYGEIIFREVITPSQSTIALKQQLEPILETLKAAIISYEASISFGVTWQFAQKEDELIEKLLESACILEAWQFKKFLKNPDNLDIDEEYSFLELEKFVKTYFHQPILYVLGNWAVFRLYLVGQIKNGDLLGTVTAASWT